MFSKKKDKKKSSSDDNNTNNNSAASSTSSSASPPAGDSSIGSNSSPSTNLTNVLMKKFEEHHLTNVGELQASSSNGSDRDHHKKKKEKKSSSPSSSSSSPSTAKKDTSDHNSNSSSSNTNNNNNNKEVGGKDGPSHHLKDLDDEKKALLMEHFPGTSFMKALEATQKQHQLSVANDPDHPEIQRELPDDPVALQVEAIRAITTVVGRDLPEDETQPTSNIPTSTSTSSLRQGVSTPDYKSPDVLTDEYFTDERIFKFMVFNLKVPHLPKNIDPKFLDPDQMTLEQVLELPLYRFKPGFGMMVVQAPPAWMKTIPVPESSAPPSPPVALKKEHSVVTLAASPNSHNSSFEKKKKGWMRWGSKSTGLTAPSPLSTAIANTSYTPPSTFPLGHDLLVQIISKLPFTDILKCACVCRFWYHVLCDTSLILKKAEEIAPLSVSASSKLKKKESIQKAPPSPASTSGPLSLPSTPPKLDKLEKLLGREVSYEALPIKKQTGVSVEDKMKEIIAEKEAAESTSVNSPYGLKKRMSLLYSTLDLSQLNLSLGAKWAEMRLLELLSQPRFSIIFPASTLDHPSPNVSPRKLSPRSLAGIPATTTAVVSILKEIKFGPEFKFPSSLLKKVLTSRVGSIDSIVFAGCDWVKPKHVKSVSKILGGDQGPALDSPTTGPSNPSHTTLAIPGIKTGVRGLRVLDIGNCQAVNYPKSLMDSFKSFPALQVLTLDNLHRVVNQPFLARVVAACPNLTNVSFVNCFDFDDSCAKLLATNLQRITRLIVCGCEVTDAGLLEIATLRQLRILSIGGCRRITDRGISEVARGCLELERLELSTCSELTDVGLMTLSEHLHKLRVIHAVHCVKLTAKSLYYLLTRCPLLAILNFNKCSLLGNGWENFSSLETNPETEAKSVVAFSAKGTNLSDLAFSMIGKHLLEVNLLDLGRNTNLTDESLEPFLPKMINIKRMKLRGTGISTDLVQRVIPSFPGLAYVDVRDCRNVKRIVVDKSRKIVIRRVGMNPPPTLPYVPGRKKVIKKASRAT